VHQPSIADWLPDRPPTWADVFLAGFGFFSLVEYAVSSTTPAAWEWVAVGVVGSVLAFGPLANSAVGDRVNEWWDRIGVGGRALAIVGFAVVCWTVIWQEPAIRAPVDGVATGGFAVLFVVLAVFVVRHRPIRGWMPRYDLERDDP
jgi:hypothetical protein